MGEHRALLVANAKYQEDSSLPDLMAPIYDMSRLRDALTNPSTGLFRRDAVVQLADARSRDILATMEDFFGSADPEDTLLLYFSGHGKTDINNNFFLCAADTNTKRLFTTAIHDDLVNRIMRGSPATTHVIILDCCSSGSWKGTAELPANLRGEGRFVLQSSRPGQNSSDATVLTESSPFTKLLVEAMETADLDTDLDGYVDIDAVYKHIQPRLKGQQAQRDYDRSTATVALARRPLHVLADGGALAGSTQATGISSDVIAADTTGDDPHVHSVGTAAPPSLTVSPEQINDLDVELGDLPVVERIYVFNRGGGDLTWTPESDNDWISLEVHPEFVRVSLAPNRPGVHRGAIYIRPHGPGRVVRVPVVVRVSSTTEPSRSVLEIETPSARSIGTTVVDGRNTSPSAPQTKPGRKTNRARLEDELKRLGYELDPWSPNIWYSDDYIKGHKKPRVAIRPPRIRMEALDQATGTWHLTRSYSLESELEAAFTEIASVRRARQAPPRAASDAAQEPDTADELLTQFREKAIPTVPKSNVPAWQGRMASELRRRRYIHTANKNQWVHLFAMGTQNPSRITLTETTVEIEGRLDSRFGGKWNPAGVILAQVTKSFEMERQFDEALSLIDQLYKPTLSSWQDRQQDRNR